MPKVVVIGAGFSGLVAAWRLQKDGFDVTVIEKAARPGGMISTSQRSYGLVETAANGLLCTALVEELFLDCNLEVQQPKKTAKRRYIEFAGKISRWPLGFFETLNLGLKIARIKRSPPHPRETLFDWGRRALGEAATVKILAPAMLGVYAADLRLLSANLLVGKFFSKSRRPLRGKVSGTVACTGGMGQLIISLQNLLEGRGVKFYFGFDGTEEIEVAKRNRVPVVLTTAAWDATHLLKADRRTLALSKIKSLPLISIAAFFNSAPPKKGFGTLFAQSVENRATSLTYNDGILGALQNSEIFEGRSKAPMHSETWIMGGASLGDELSRLSDAELVSLALAKRKRLIEGDEPVEAIVTRWPRAIPLYSLELEELIPELLRDGDGIVLFGNYLGELGLSSILEATRGLSERVRKI